MGFITIQGENQIAAKQGAGETLNITGFVLANIDGLGAEPVNRIASLPAPADIMDELNVTKFGYVNTNQVVYSLVMDSSIGDYDFNWVGLVDDEGVLIAVTHTPLIQKRATSGGVPGNNLTRNFLIAYSGIQATTAIAVPAETWQIDFNARLHGIDERERLSNFDIYGEASFMDTGWQVARDGSTTTYNVLPGIGYVGGIRIASAIAQPITVASGPNSIWVDVSLQGDISDMSPVVDFVVSNVAQANYTDPNGFKHYLTKLCSVAAGGAVTDTRSSADQLADHLANPDPHSQYLTQSEANALYKPRSFIDMPIGALLVMDGDVVPNGFLKRNGTEVSRASYPALWAYAQTISNFVPQSTKDADPEDYAGYYGDGDGSSTFTVPDWRGEFWRAWDDGRGVDTGRGVGEWRTDKFKSHRHDIDNMQGSGTPNSVSDNIAASQNTTTSTGHQSGFTGENETAPRSLSGMALVKAFQPI